MLKPFKDVAGLKPGHSVFDLSKSKLFNADFGNLYPVWIMDCVPGDVFKLSNEIVVRIQPLVAPILDEMKVFCHTFFIPYRILIEDFDKAISGGDKGTYGDGQECYFPKHDMTADDAKKGSLWDYFGFPLKYKEDGKVDEGNPFVLDDLDKPIEALWTAYNLIWEEYYRDENLCPVPDDKETFIDLKNRKLLKRAWKKDYFTTALPFRQRGTSPAFSVQGSIGLNFPQNSYITANRTENSISQISIGFDPVVTLSESYIPNNYGIKLEGSKFEGDSASAPANGWLFLRTQDSSDRGSLTVVNSQKNPATNGQSDNVYTKLLFGSGGVSGDSGEPSIKFVSKNITSNITANANDAVTFDVNDIRTAFQIQKFLERNARGGVRYVEFLRAHFGISPTDETLQRPEYVGGSMQYVTVSEVLQTSESSTTSALGTQGGHAISIARSKIGNYRCKEFGILMTLLSIMPRPNYSQGINRMWNKNTRYDWYFPEFQHLSEQGILNSEIYLEDSSTGKNREIFGFQGIYDHMRYAHNDIAGDIRDTLDYWNLGRKFSALPQLNQQFITVDSEQDGLKRIFAVQDEPSFIVHYAQNVTAIRPMSATGEPGLVDHF